MRKALWLGLLALCLAALATPAQDPSELRGTLPSNDAPARVEAARLLPVDPITFRSVFSGEHTWEEWHDYWSEDISHRVDYIDHFFGDEILKDDNRDTRVVMQLGFRSDRFDPVSVESRINVRVGLPQLQRRLQLILDSGSDAEDVKALRVYENAAKVSDPAAGVRYLLKDESRTRLHFDTGVHFSQSPQVFGRARARYTLPLNLWQLRLQERVEVLHRDGFEETSEMIWDRQLPGKALFRIRSAVDWEEKNRGVTPAQSLAYYGILNARASYKIRLLGSWSETPYGGTDVYTFATGYRRIIYGDWLFLEVSPGLEFSSERDYDVNPFIAAIFEITFQRDKPLAGDDPAGLDRR